MKKISWMKKGNKMNQKDNLPKIVLYGYYQKGPLTGVYL